MAEPIMDIRLSSENMMYIDITPNASQPTYAYLGYNITQNKATETETSEMLLYKDKGGKRITSVSKSVAVECESMMSYGDPAVEYIRRLEYVIGTGLQSRYKLITPIGDVHTGTCAINNVTPVTGASNEEEKLTFTINFNGIPDVVWGNDISQPLPTMPTPVFATNTATFVFAQIEEGFNTAFLAEKMIILDANDVVTPYAVNISSDGLTYTFSIASGTLDQIITTGLVSVDGRIYPSQTFSATTTP